MNRNDPLRRIAKLEAQIDELKFDILALHSIVDRLLNIVDTHVKGTEDKENCDGKDSNSG